MKIELIKTDGNTIGYNLVSENSDEQYALNTIRNLHYFGIEENAIRYDGYESTPDGNFVNRMTFIQKKYQHLSINERKQKYTGMTVQSIDNSNDDGNCEKTNPNNL